MSFTRAATIALAAVIGSAVAAPVAGAATLDLLGAELEIPLPDFSQEPPPAPAPTPPAPAPAPAEPAPATPPPAVAPAAPAPAAAPAAPVTVPTIRRAASKIRAQVAPVDVPPAPVAPVVTPDPALVPPATPTTEPAPVPTLPAETIPAPLADSDSGSGFLSLLGAMLIRMVAITVWLVAASFLVLTQRRGAVPAV